MSDDMPSTTKDAKPVTVPTERSETDAGLGKFDAHDGDDASRKAHEAARPRNDRPYGFAIVIIGIVAAIINAVLVGVLMTQTSAVQDQLELSQQALEISNESFLDTLAEMRQQRDAMTAQVESVSALTSTLQQILQDQQRARVSFRVQLEQINDVQTGIRVVCPIEIGGTTEARQVHFKNYVSSGTPGQQQFLGSLSLDWSQRESHPLTDISPTEVGRRFVTPVLSKKRVRTVVSKEESLYFVGRLEYCDVYGACRYFMRCAEFGYQPGVVSYCGTRMGNL